MTDFFQTDTKKVAASFIEFQKRIDESVNEMSNKYGFSFAQDAPLK